MSLVRLSTALALAAFVLAGCGEELAAERPGAERPFAGRTLVLFVGSASRPATELAARRFEERTGARLELHFGGSGEMLARLELAGRGDLYFPGSSDYLELAERKGLVDPGTETVIAYLVPAINVPRGNPARVERLEDLARPGLRLGIARPDSVCVGLYAVEVLERAGLADSVRKNVVTHAESCAKVAQLVALGHVDAVLGWEVFEHWDPTRIETVLLPPERVPRIGTLPAAVAAASREPELARAFLAFASSAEGRACFREHGYLTSLEEARRLTAPDAPVGGEWPLPPGW